MKQVIVVVHGVGVREAGVATGQVSAVLAEKPRGPGDLPPWQAQSTDDFLLHEDQRYDEDRLMSVFPAHLRRFTRKLPDGRSQDRVIADYFWGDISGTGGGWARLMLALARIVLGLSHAARENAAEVFGGPGRGNRFLRWAARQAALLLHGPVVAVNIALFLGTALAVVGHWLFTDAAGLGSVPEAGGWIAQGLLSLALVGLGWWFLKSFPAFLQRHLGGWLILSGLFVAGLLLAQLILPQAMSSLRVLIETHLFGAPASEIPPGPQFVTLAFVLMAVMILAWALAFGLTWIVWLAALRDRREEGAISIAPQALVLMSLLWMLFMTAVWLLLRGALEAVYVLTPLRLPVEFQPEFVTTGLRFATPAGAALVALVLAAVFLHGRKSRALAAMAEQPEGYLDQRDTRANRHRLIVGGLLLRVLDLYLFLTTFLFLALILAGVTGFGPAVTLAKWNLERMPELFVVVLALCGGVVLLGRGAFAAGIAISADVLAYLNDYAWMSREHRRAKEEKRAKGEVPLTWFERLPGLGPDLDNLGRGFWLRGRIMARLHGLVVQLIRDEAPDEIILLSHSQGTVIAVESLEKMGEGWVKAAGGRLRIKLVTMGSPYRHLYRAYFPSDFPRVPAMTNVRPLDQGGILSDWVNIFRIDDFVGTHIDGGDGAPTGWPRECPVAPGGHTGYWVDRAVIPILQEVLAFPPPPAPASDRE